VERNGNKRKAEEVTSDLKKRISTIDIAVNALLKKKKSQQWTFSTRCNGSHN
jgi:chaperonin cofactor prefoldin